MVIGSYSSNRIRKRLQKKAVYERFDADLLDKIAERKEVLGIPCMWRGEYVDRASLLFFESSTLMECKCRSIFCEIACH